MTAVGAPADDVIDAADANPLLDLVEIVKVDARDTEPAMRRELAQRFRGRVNMLAEKVETRAEQVEAIDLSYELLQGYVLYEPAVVSVRRALLEGEGPHARALELVTTWQAGEWTARCSLLPSWTWIPPRVSDFYADAIEFVNLPELRRRRAAAARR